MSFYVRKSVRVGPFRFNLSKSGIGVSAGIRGFRVGSGPRGNYIHLGRDGFYYRQTIPIERPKAGSRIRDVITDADTLVTHGPMEEIASGAVTKMVDSSSEKLLTELEAKRRRVVWWPIALMVSVALLGGLAFVGLKGWIIVLLGVVFSVGTLAVYVHDVLNKSVVIMYDLDDTVRKAFEDLHERVLSIGRCGATWHVNAKAQVYDPKYHAGAGQIVDRRRIHVHPHDPPYVKTNVEPMRIPLGKRSFYVLPDRIIVYGEGAVGAICYEDLQIVTSPKRFIEEEGVPSDAEIVDRTWKYVNKDGGPDRRFNNNRELPVCLYEELHLSSPTGLNEVIQLSRRGMGSELLASVSRLSTSLQEALTAEKERRLVLKKSEYCQDVTATQVDYSVVESSTYDDTTRHAPSLETLCDILLQTMCCVMASDGRASQSEKRRICEIMTKAGSPWDIFEIESRIDAFVDIILQHGFKRTLTNTLARVHLFKESGRQSMLLRCIDLIAVADKSLDRRETALCEQIRQIVSD